MPQTEAWITMGCVGNEVVPAGRHGPVAGGPARRRTARRPAPARRHPGGGAQRRRLHRRLRVAAGPERAHRTDRPRDERRAASRRSRFPARLVVPGLYGYESAVKWLDRIQLAAQDYEAFWVQRGYANRRSSARSPASTSPTGRHCYAPAPCSSRAWCGPAPGRLPGPGQRRRRTMAAGPARRHHARRRRLAPVDLDLDLAGDSGSPRAEGAGHRRNRAGPARPLPRSSARRRHRLAQGRGRGTCATAGRPDSAPGPMRWWGRADSVRYVSSRKAARPGWRGTVGWSG